MTPLVCIHTTLIASEERLAVNKAAQRAAVRLFFLPATYRAHAMNSFSFFSSLSHPFFAENSCLTNISFSRLFFYFLLVPSRVHCVHKKQHIFKREFFSPFNCVGTEKKTSDSKQGWPTANLSPTLHFLPRNFAICSRLGKERKTESTVNSRRRGKGDNILQLAILRE